MILFNTLGEDKGQAAGTTTTAAEIVREDSHPLSQAPDEKAVLVEFLDFECESCLAAYPLVEDLSEEYGENLTVVSRYFPLPGHPNSETAAAAVEAAAQQGKFKDMHARMYETQTEWAHTNEDRSPVFREYAQDLGLDMAAYDAAIADPATMERVNADKNDGIALNVEWIWNRQAPVPTESAPEAVKEAARLQPTVDPATYAALTGAFRAPGGAFGNGEQYTIIGTPPDRNRRSTPRPAGTAGQDLRARRGCWKDTRS